MMGAVRPTVGLKLRGNKLHNFVNAGGPDSDALDDEFQTALIRQEEADDQDNGGPSGMPVKTSREQIAKDMRLEMPKPDRAGGHLQEHRGASQHRSPERSRHASPRPPTTRPDSVTRYNALFAPSEMGDDFMRSEMSTPHPQLNDPEEGSVSGRNSNANASRSHHGRPPKRHEKRGGPPLFSANDDGFLAVVSSGKKHTPPALRDGFARDTYIHQKDVDQYGEDHALPPSGVELQVGLPIRTEPRRLIKAKENRVVYSAQATPDFEQDQSQRKQHREYRTSPQRQVVQPEVQQSEASEDELRVTPRARRIAEDAHAGTFHVEEPTQYSSRECSRARKRHREDPDYDDQVLSSMSYKDLHSESFDFDPSKAALAGQINDGTHDLSTKLEQRRHRAENEQQAFFASMPMQEWEDSGDWFVDQFAALMKKMRDARREKRLVVRSFEEEAERREAMVRRKAEGIDKKLVKMRQDGLKVVADVSS